MTDTTTAPTAGAEQRVHTFYVPGPLGADELAAALRAAHAQLSVALQNHDVFSVLYDTDQAKETGYQLPEFEQIARAVLAALFGISALETRNPLQALQIWQRQNKDSSLAWAFGEAVSSISPKDRAAVELFRAEQRGFRPTETR